MKVEIKEDRQTGSYTATFNTEAVDIRDFKTVGMQLDLDGTATGTAKIQVTNNESKANWVDYDGSSKDLTGNDHKFWSIANASFKFARIAVALSAGSGDYVSDTLAKGA